jgi:hypothetical protein
MFPAPRQRWVDAMASAEAAVRALPHQTLILHGRDDRVITLQTSLTLSDWIVRSQLHVFGCCGHWTQIEHDAISSLGYGFREEAALMSHCLGFMTQIDARLFNLSFDARENCVLLASSIRASVKSSAEVDFGV